MPPELVHFAQGCVGLALLIAFLILAYDTLPEA